MNEKLLIKGSDPLVFWYIHPDFEDETREKLEGMYKFSKKFKNPIPIISKSDIAIINK